MHVFDMSCNVLAVLSKWYAILLDTNVDFRYQNSMKMFWLLNLCNLISLCHGTIAIAFLLTFESKETFQYTLLVCAMGL
jgi:hypothetical protein